MLDRSMWKKHPNVFYEHIYYVGNKIHKPFKMGILDYSERVPKMSEMYKILPFSSRKNEE